MNDESLTDDGDKMALGDAILKHVGTNSDSNAFFTEVITNEELGPLRFLALGHLTGVIARKAPCATAKNSSPTSRPNPRRRRPQPCAV